MRRVASALLVLVFSLPLIAPALLSALASASDGSQLPACCRRDGKHHCAMSMTMGNIPSRYRTVSEKCPFSPFGHSTLMIPHAFALNNSPASLVRTASPESIVREAEAGYRISADRTRHKRGPPTFLSL
jgi:hypothetical protein